MTPEEARQTYVLLIETARANNPIAKRSVKHTGYEIHHIIPKCKARGGKDIDDNVVTLTYREHFVAHQLLVDIYPEHSLQQRSMKFALMRMCHGKYEQYASIEEYERARLHNSQATSALFLGKPQTSKHRRNMSIAMSNRSEQEKENAAQKRRMKKRKRWKFTKEQSEAQSQRQRGKPKSEKMKLAVSGTNNYRHKPVECFTKEWKFIAVFETMTLASQEMNVNKAHICDVCKGKRQFAGGYRWCYKVQNIK